MQRDRKKLERLISNLKSVSVQEANFMQQGNNVRWACFMLRIAGTKLEDEEISEIFSGNIVYDSTIFECTMIENLQKLRRDYKHMADFDICMNEEYLKKIHALLRGKVNDDYRKTNPIIRDMSYNPPHPAEIPGLMRECSKEIQTKKHFADMLNGSIQTHNLIMSIWPYEEMSDLLACAAMSYELYKAGYPLPTLEISKAEHLRLTASFIKEKKTDEFRKLLIENLCDECVRDRRNL